MSDIGFALRAGRIAAGLEQAKIAEILGLSPQFICDVESGRRSLNPAHFAKLPEPVRRSVVVAAIGNLEVELKALRELLS